MSGSLWRASLGAIRTETPRLSAQGQGGKDIITEQITGGCAPPQPKTPSVLPF